MTRAKQLNAAVSAIRTAVEFSPDGETEEEMVERMATDPNGWTLVTSGPGYDVVVHLGVVFNPAELAAIATEAYVTAHFDRLY